MFLYKTIAFSSLGLSIIYLTIIIRFILFPVFQKSVHHQTITQHLQPEIEKIRKQHKDNPIKQSEKIMQLYKDNNINPFSSFLFLLIQFPILIALYQIIINVVRGKLYGAYSFIVLPNKINTVFLGLIHLEKPSIILAVAAAVAQLIQTRMSMPKKQANQQSFSGRMSRQMMFIGPLVTLVILYYLPSAIAVYWVTATIFSIFQQSIVNNKISKNGGNRIIYKKSTETGRV